MRFRSLYGRRGVAPTNCQSSPVSPSSSPPPRVPPPATAVQWRSLWGRVYARWTTPPVSTTPAQRASLSPVAPSSPCKDATPPLPAKRVPPAGLRAYLHRKRGELWFLTKRRALDADRDSSAASEVEVPAPPIAPTPPTTSVSVARPRPSLLRLRSQHSSSSSELEVGMSSYSASSDGLDDDDEYDDSDSDSDGLSDDDDGERVRDSYATTRTESDPFLQRYSSWGSLDEEEHAPACVSDAADDADEEGEDQQDDADLISRSPTLAELYEVRFVDIGGTPTPVVGIWV